MELSVPNLSPKEPCRLEVETSFRGESRVVLSLSGGLHTNHLAKLLMLVQSAQGLGLQVTLNLAPLKSVDREALRGILGWRDRGVQFLQCPEYVQRWVRGEILGAGASAEPPPRIARTSTHKPASPPGETGKQDRAPRAAGKCAAS